MILFIILFCIFATVDNANANEKPEVLNPTIIPNSPLTDDDLQAVYDIYDAEGDNIEDIHIRWFKNGLEQAQYGNLETIPANATAKNELWYYTIRAYDGFNYSDENTSSFVEISNSPPQVKDVSHDANDIIASETEILDFYVLAEDPDGDLLLFNWTLDGEQVEDDDDYVFETDYESSGTYILNLSIQDAGENSYLIYREWTIIVMNVNRKPEIEGKQPMEKDVNIKEDTTLIFSIAASDPDSKDTLHITWYIDEVVAQSGGSYFKYHPDHESAGFHEVSVLVDDGTDSVEHTWNVAVEDTEASSPDSRSSSGYLFSFLLILAIIVIVVIIVIVIVIVFSDMKINQ